MRIQKRYSNKHTTVQRHVRYYIPSNLTIDPIKYVEAFERMNNLMPTEVTFYAPNNR